MLKNLILSAAKFSKAIYSEEEVLASEIFQIENIRTGVDLRGYLNGSHLTVAFRGTDSDDLFADWRTNLKCEFGYMDLQRRPATRITAHLQRRPSTRITAHIGFIDAYKSIRESLHVDIKGSHCKSISYVGHSLGGAMAMLAFVDQPQKGIEKDCITFGAPRVFHQDFTGASEYYKSRIIRVENAGDIVPHLPPAFSLFRHIGQEMHLRKGKLYVNPSFIQKAMLLLSSPPHPFNHSIDKYVEQLQLLGEF